MILILNVMVEVTIGGDQSVDRNGGTEGKHSTHLNMDQSSGFEYPSRSGFVEGGGVCVCERNNTHCVIFPSHALVCLPVLYQLKALLQA